MNEMKALQASTKTEDKEELTKALIKKGWRRSRSEEGHSEVDAKKCFKAVHLNEEMKAEYMNMKARAEELARKYKELEIPTTTRTRIQGVPLQKRMLHL